MTSQNRKGDRRRKFKKSESAKIRATRPSQSRDVSSLLLPRKSFFLFFLLLLFGLSSSVVLLTRVLSSTPFSGLSCVSPYHKRESRKRTGSIPLSLSPLPPKGWRAFLICAILLPHLNSHPQPIRHVQRGRHPAKTTTTTDLDCYLSILVFELCFYLPRSAFLHWFS